jgi:hypothetical protein
MQFGVCVQGAFGNRGDERSISVIQEKYDAEGKINILETSPRKLPSFFVILEAWFSDSTFVTLTKKRFVIEMKRNNSYLNLRQIADLAGANYGYARHVWADYVRKEVIKKEEIAVGSCRNVDVLGRSNNV